MLTRALSETERRDDPVWKINLITLYWHLSSNQVALQRHQDVIESATAGLELAVELNAVTRIAEALHMRASGHAGVGDTVSALEDITDALERLGNLSEGSHSQKLRGNLLELRGLILGSDGGDLVVSD